MRTADPIKVYYTGGDSHMRIGDKCLMCGIVQLGRQCTDDRERLPVARSMQLSCRVNEALPHTN